MSALKRFRQRRVRARWVRALRSGNYQQAKNVLHRTDGDSAGYCCLGVLCDLAEKAGLVEPLSGHKTAATVEYRSLREPTDFSDTVLPEVVRRWAGLTTGEGELNKAITADILLTGSDRILYHDEIGSLAGLNDRANYTFNQIADVIESGNLRTQETST